MPGELLPPPASFHTVTLAERVPMGPLTILEGVRTVQLTQGYNALVDEASYDLVMTRKWGVMKSDREHCVYVRHGTTRQGKYINTLLHRFLLGEPVGQYVDHRNGDGRDNRIANLRICTISQNGGNSRKICSNTGFKGVGCYRPGTRHPYNARIRVNGKTHLLGSFATAEEAARAYDAKARELFGEFAATNADSLPVQPRRTRQELDAAGISRVRERRRR